MSSSSLSCTDYQDLSSLGFCMARSLVTNSRITTHMPFVCMMGMQKKQAFHM